MVSAKKLCYVALLTALNVALSSFSVPVPGGHFYRVAGGGDFVDFRGRKGVEKGIFVRGKAGITAVLSCRSGAADGHGDYGNGLYAGQGVCVRHEGICDYQTAVRNSAGGRRGGDCADFSL